jgi:hypothetical protein
MDDARPTWPVTFTDIRQVDEQTMLAMVEFALMTGGWVERVKPIEERPGIWSVLTHPRCDLPDTHMCEEPTTA